MAELKSDSELVAITGATGFLGGQVVRQLLASGRRVRALVRNGTDDCNLDGLPIETVAGDLADRPALERLCLGADRLIHLAALVSFRGSDAEELQRANVDGTSNVLSAARDSGVRRLLHCSSVASIGLTQDGRPADETCRWELAGFQVDYLSTKRLSEEMALEARTSDFEVVVVNPAALFGPGDRRQTAYESVQRVRTKGLPIKPPGGLCVADVRDVAAGLLTALDQGVDGERYILGGENLRGAELAEHLVRPFGRKSPRIGVPGGLLVGLASVLAGIERVLPLRSPWPTGVLRLAAQRFWFDSGKAARELGYRCRPFAETMRDTAAFLDSRSASPKSGAVTDSD